MTQDTDMDNQDDAQESPEFELESAPPVEIPIKRAGADFILTYHATDAAGWLGA